MSEEQKLLRMYKEVHGEESGRCYTEIAYADEYPHEAIGVNLMKDGNLVAFYSKTDLLFDYVTKDWESEDE